MKAFSERNPVAVAVAGLTTMAAIAVATFYSSDLPIIGGGTAYAANFTDAGALTEGADVRVAGVKVGSVDSVDLVRQHVRVGFTVKDTWIGNESSAAIKIKTLLGQEYLEIDPEGPRALADGGLIPVARTTTPLDVNAALSGLSDTVGRIDTGRLATSFDVLSAAFRDTPRSVRAALDGMSALSRTISERDATLRRLAANTAEVTGSLARSDADFARLIEDGNLLLQELRARSSAINGLLTGTRDLSRQLSGLVRDNDRTLAPALASLTKVTDILVANKGNLDRALKLIGPYYSMLADATGSGRWIDVYICGLLEPDGTPILGATTKRNCRPRSGS